MTRYDMVYERYGVYLEPHFCREWSVDSAGEMVGCYGTDPDHGYTWEDGKQELIDWHQKQIDWLKEVKEEDYYA